MKSFFYLIIFLLANNKLMFASQDEMSRDPVPPLGENAGENPEENQDLEGLTIEDLNFLSEFVSPQIARELGWAVANPQN